MIGNDMLNPAIHIRRRKIHYLSCLAYRCLTRCLVVIDILDMGGKP